MRHTSEFWKHVAEVLSFLMFAIIFDAERITSHLVYKMLVITLFSFTFISLCLMFIYNQKKEINNSKFDINTNIKAGICDNQIQMLSNNNLSGMGKFGECLSKIVGDIIEYRKWKIKISQENKESLYFLILKDYKTGSNKIQKFLNKSFQYLEDGNEITLQTARIIDSLDEKVFDAIIKINNLVKIQERLDGILFCVDDELVSTDKLAYEDVLFTIKILINNGLLSTGQGFGSTYYCNEAISLINKINNLTL